MSNIALKEILERTATALHTRPVLAQRTAATRVRLTENLRCEVEEGPWNFSVDMSAAVGGGGAAPNPGILGRASLGSCLAVGYAMWAARLGITIRSLAVEVQADFDARPEYGVPGGSPGYQQVRCLVDVDSDASAEQWERLQAFAHAGSSYLHVWADPQDVRIVTRRAEEA